MDPRDMLATQRETVLASNERPVLTILLISMAVCMTIGFDDLHAQSTTDSTWQAEATARLKAIYERSEFRVAKRQGEWLPDSSGYAVRETDPATKKPSAVSYDVRTGQRSEAKLSEDTPSNRRQQLSPDGKLCLELRDQDLFVRDLERGEQTRLTNRSPERDISFRDPKWSPDGKRIAFVEADATDVKFRSVLVPDDPSYPKVDNRRFARVGEVIESLRVGVVNRDGSDLKWLPIEVPKSGGYLGQVEWVGNSEEVLVESLSRFRDKREFLLVSVSGQLKTLFSESNNAWAIPSQSVNSGLTWMRDGKRFIVVSEKDGWRHAYLCSRESHESTLLTPGDYDMIERSIMDEEGGWYYFYASPNNGTQKHLYRVPLDGSGTLELITPNDQPGTHDYEFAPNAKWALHTYSTLDSPPIVELVAIPEHRVVCVLEENSELRTKMKTVISHPTEFLRLDIGEGVSMDAWMIKPKDFDASKKYPVFIYVYGEPHAQTVLDSWGAAQIDFHRVVADFGYLVVSIDNRGTPAPKGAAWRRSIFGSLGPLSTEEQAAGLKELGRTRPYVDLSRVGIWGWSGGGSNTLNAMFRKPDQYHIGIAVVPKPQPHLYNAWFQEIYMRTREVNPNGYERSAPINFAEGLKGKLLMITGSGETNTHIQIIEGLVDRLIELGKPFDYMVYPNRDHGLREGRGSEVHVRMLIIRYLLQHLPAGPKQQ